MRTLKFYVKDSFLTLCSTFMSTDVYTVFKVNSLYIVFLDHTKILTSLQSSNSFALKTLFKHYPPNIILCGKNLTVTFLNLFKRFS